MNVDDVPNGRQKHGFSTCSFEKKNIIIIIIIIIIYIYIDCPQAKYQYILEIEQNIPMF